ncbi:hypothetical protein RJT34_13473 [Clitoria ternatea]|uniref:Protein EXECUTER 1, chloroplastic n=1 Tax=Clitoria ternatea TaxID=43366 RepID=A0AAN9JR44_CLITE
MASITSSPTITSTKLNFPNPKPPFPSPHSDVVSNSIKKFHSLRATSSVSFQDNNDHHDWDWDRWRNHFQDIDEQERFLSILKSQMGDAVRFEDYEDAATLKVAIAAVATNDTVGTAISHLNKAIEEERYSDAAYLRDKAGAGLVGWWAGMSKDVNDPHGLIIRITPEHGRYVARSYSPRQLATAAAGVPLFEIFLTKNEKGEFKSQVVYLKRRGAFRNPPTTSFEALDAAERLKSVESPVGSTEDSEGVDDKNDSSDPSHGFHNILKNIIPGIKMTVLKETISEKADKEEDDADKDNETASPELELIKPENGDDVELNSSLETFEEEQNKIAVKVVSGGLLQKLSSSLATRDLLRIPAKLETIGLGSFSFTVEKLVNQLVGHGKGKPSFDKSTKIQGQRSFDHVMFDLAKFIGKGKVPSKVLKDVKELINLSLSRARNHDRLTGSTIFNRIEIPASPDPLNGLYVGAHGLYSSEVIQLRRGYGHWQDDGRAKDSSDLEFYEYVEALKLTGDPYVPVGQVAFRAKVGKRHQLPHKGIIPEEFGLIARYKGQGRLAEPGFQNPRWVDGELVILDGKYIKAGPVVGFVYWAPKYHFLVLFNRLRIQ